MEDAHTHVLDLDAGADTAITPVKQRRSFFAVYDGHGGSLPRADTRRLQTLRQGLRSRNMQGTRSTAG
jgi:hypothetical protein